MCAQLGKVVLLVGIVWSPTILAGESDDAEVLFVRHVATILQEKCIGCHGADIEKREGGLDLSSRDGALLGGESGRTALVPNQPNTSGMLLAARRTHDEWSAMPPKESESLSAEQLTWLEQWIRGGAPWPDEQRSEVIRARYEDKWEKSDGIAVKTSKGLSASWTDRRYDPDSLWAYRPLRLPEDLPAADRVIDTLIADRFPPQLDNAPAADRRTLIRRATFDLTGLPPTIDEVRQFLEDSSDDATAFAKLVDRLLASPHYGERMAQHWLDVVRYADSSGFANDYARGNAWRYRDYIVRSFNADKPYTQFIMEQLAGDELDPDNPEALIATGFLRMGPWELTAMEVAKIARQRFLDDVTNSVGETFLAHSLQCARCHDHKFDPIPTRDYYAVQAVFATTQLAERECEFLERENTQGFEERRFLDQRQAEYDRMLAELDVVLLRNSQEWFTQQGLPDDAWQAAVAQARDTVRPGRVFDTARSRLQKQGLDERTYPPKLVGFTPEQFGQDRIARKGLERLRWEYDSYEPVALAVYNGRTLLPSSVNSPLRIPADRETQGELEATAILVGGDPFSPGEPVTPGSLSVLHGLVDVPFPQSMEGRRSALAAWITDPANPLTPRVIANRVWQWHFGQALAANPNNFGSTGKRPSHPELLDWLAQDLIDSGWSIKSLHRRIMNSAAYRRASQHPRPDSVAQYDPYRTSYAVFQPRRLSAEEMRDAMLAVTGELNRSLGGIPCRPNMNLEVALQPRMVMGTFAAAWTPNILPDQRNRRSLYVLRLRGLIDPLFQTFNAPSPDFSCERRENSSVTPQVFYLFNSQNSYDRALALAHRASMSAESESADSDSAVIEACYVHCFGRSPTAKERQACLDHWQATLTSLPVDPPVRQQPPVQVVRNAIEENTGETFRFTERLYSNEHYVPDLQAADLSRRVRALGDVCLVLLNSHEFLYVY
jgi:hypothetical protein